MSWQSAPALHRDLTASRSLAEWSTEVSCQSAELAQRVLADLVVGDRVVVVGALRLDPVPGPVEDASSVARVSLDAVVVGWDLDP